MAAPSSSGLDQVGQPELQAHLVEAEALLDHEGLVQRERQLEQRRRCSAKPASSASCCVMPGPSQRQQRLVQRVEPAQQRPAQQHGGAEGQLQQAEAGLGDRVVGRLLVGGQGHGAGEGGGHGVAMPGDVADLARRQPELDAQAREQESGERQSQRVGSGSLQPSLGHQATIASMSETAAPAARHPPEKRPEPVWLDCEMTGLDPEVDRLIEIAVIVTGADLDAADRGPGARRSTRATRSWTRWMPGTRAPTAAAA